MGMSERIKQKRTELGLTQEELAEKLGIQKSAVAKKIRERTCGKYKAFCHCKHGEDI